MKKQNSDRSLAQTPALEALAEQGLMRASVNPQATADHENAVEHFALQMLALQVVTWRHEQNDQSLNPTLLPENLRLPNQPQPYQQKLLAYLSKVDRDKLTYQEMLVTQGMLDGGQGLEELDHREMLTVV